MLLGIPRLFGRTGKTQKTTEVVVEVPPKVEKVVDEGKGLVQWAKAHPFQLFVLGALAFSIVKRFWKPKKASVVKGVEGKSGAMSRANGSAVKAVPRRHETTEEALDLLGNTARKYVMVGGKGGVGKTSMSAAVATAFADRGQTTLIVSTDPAHSLSDAFGQSVAGGDPVAVVGIDNLYAQEVDPDTMKRTFKMMDGMGGMGMDELGLDELNSLFDSIPPGFDEAVALVEIIKYIQGDPSYARFERIVFDTAPTGHTLRLLALPDFLNGFFGKIISMKSKFGNMMQQFKGMFGGGKDDDLNASVEDMEELKRSMQMVRDLFRDEIQTEFIVATIPNMMAIAESSRLVEELRKEQIPVRHLFVNQVQPGNDDCSFCAARYKEHAANLRFIKSQFGQLQISTVQSFDREIKGAAALRTMGGQLFPKAVEPASDDVTTKGHDVSGVSRPEPAKAELIE